MRHGDPVPPDLKVLDTDAALGLAVSIEDWLELNPCVCEALCTCDKEE